MRLRPGLTSHNFYDGWFGLNTDERQSFLKIKTLLVLLKEMFREQHYLLVIFLHRMHRILDLSTPPVKNLEVL